MNLNLTSLRTLILIGLAFVGVSVFSGAMAQDVGSSYGLNKQAQYTQDSTASPTLDGYQFTSSVAAGSSGTLKLSSSVTLPPGSTGTVTYTYDDNGDLFFTTNTAFATKADFDAAYPDSTTNGYTMTIKTSTPNTYTVPFNLGPDNYPTTVPQITNTNWSGGSLVFDATQDFTFTFNGFTGKHLTFYFNGTNVDEVSNPDGTQTSFTLPANTLAPNTFYDINGLIFLNPGGTHDTTTIPGSKGDSSFSNNDQFSIQTSPVLRIVSITHPANNTIDLQCLGAPNASNRIESSPDLSPGSFTPLASVTADSAGDFQYEDTSAGTKKFYRLAYP